MQGGFDETAGSPSKGASQENPPTEDRRAASWWKVKAWQFARLLGSLSEGWWLGGGRLSYWKMVKLAWVALLCLVVVVVVMGLVIQVVGKTIATIMFWIVAIIVGVVAVGALIWSWVQWVRGKS